MVLTEPISCTYAAPVLSAPISPSTAATNRRFPVGQKRGLRREVKNDPTDPNYSRPPAKKAGLSVFAILSMLLRGHYT